MKKIKLFLVLVLGVAITTVSCKKDDNTGGNGGDDNTTKTCYVNTVDNEDSHSFISYNADHTIGSITNKDSSGNIESRILFTYSHGKQEQIEIYDESNVVAKYEFHYTAGASVPDTAYIFSDTLGNGGNLVKVGAMVMSFNNDKLTSISEVYSIVGMTLVMSKIEYTYNGDNISEIKEYEINFSSFKLELVSTTTYQYDNKNGLAYGIDLDYFSAIMHDNLSSKNNITQELYKDENGTQDDAQSYNHTYEYNSNGYPVKDTKVSLDNSDTTITIYTYNCSK